MRRTRPVPSLLDLVATLTGRRPRRSSRAALVTASHELEDRYGLQRRAAPLLFGGFQRARFFATDEGRWTTFAAEAAVAVAVVGDERTGVRDGRLTVVRVGPADPFWNDWLCLAYAGESRSGLLIARDVERTPDDPDATRRCHGLVTHDHRVVRAAAVWVGHYLEGHDPRLAERWRTELAEVPVELPHRRGPVAARLRQAASRR